MMAIPAQKRWKEAELLISRNNFHADNAQGRFSRLLTHYQLTSDVLRSNIFTVV